jgi:hypothetical protein
MRIEQPIEIVDRRRRRLGMEQKTWQGTDMGNKTQCQFLLVSIKDKT